MCNMDERICQERNQRLVEKLGVHDRRLNNHSDRLDSLEQHKAAFEAQISHLCEKIDGLIKTIQWGGGLLVGTLVGFFIWYIQRL